MNRRDSLPKSRKAAPSSARATIKDIARVAGVSIATVSYVLNGSKKVSENVGRRVLEAARSLSYNRNNSARTLRTGRSKTFGLILPDLTNPFFPEIAQAVQSEARALGYATILFDTQGDPALESRAIELLAEYHVDGAVWALIGETPAAVPAFPVVLIDRPVHAFDGVYTDHAEGGRLVARLAIESGHRSVGLLSGPTSVASARLRRSGFLEVAGNTLKVAWEVEVPFASRLPAAAIDALRGNRATFVFAANDVVALATLEVLSSAGLHVPNDVSLAGFDDISWAKLAPISLTTVRQPFSELGAASMRLLYERLENPNIAGRHVVLAPQLICRGSTGPLRHIRLRRKDRSS